MQTRQTRRCGHGRFFAFFCALNVAALLCGDASAQIVRVEEDWELVIGTPDADSVAPQVICMLSPTVEGAFHDLHALLTLNHQGEPDFVPGGIQLQVWCHGWCVSAHKFPNVATISQAGETIRWTQSMELADGQMTFEVTDGSSTTWGTFGGQGYLKAHFATTLTDLSGYSPAVSVAQSGVGYAENRIASFVLQRIRYITASGEVTEDTTPRVLCNHN